MMTEQELEAICEKLNYPWEKFTVDDFIDHIGRVIRKRRILQFAVANLPKPWCVSGQALDFIFYSSTIGKFLQAHHKLHEAGHFALGHVQTIQYMDDGEIVELIGRFYGNFRSTKPAHDPEKMKEENEAEYFVYLVQRKLYTFKRTNELTSITHRTNLFIPPFSGTFSRTGE